MSIFEKILGHQPMKGAENEKSSGGSEISEPRLAEGEIFLTDGLGANDMTLEDKTTPTSVESGAITPVLITAKTEDAKKPVKLEKNSIQRFRKGDIFENTTNGDSVSVEGEEIRQDMPGIRYTETYPGGALKNGGKTMWKPIEGFRVFVRGEEMKKSDPIKKKYPEFYAMYEEQIKKLESTFVWEIEAVTDALNEWSASFDKETDTKRYNQLIEQYEQLFEQVEGMREEWNGIKDSLVVTRGLKKIELFSRLRSFLSDARIPEDIRNDIVESRAERIDYEPDVELVERGYQTILLERKKEEIAGRYNMIVDSNTVVAQDMPILDNFLKQINTLYLSMNEESSSEDIRKTIDEISVIERQMFVRKNKNNTENGEAVGGLVREKPKKKRLSQKQEYKEKKTEDEGGKKKYVRNRPQGQVGENGEYSPFLTHGNGVELSGKTNTMPSGEILKQENPPAEADGVHNPATAETAGDSSWRAELDTFQEFPAGSEAIEKLKGMLVDEWGIFEQKLLDEAHKRNIPLSEDERAKLWRVSFLPQLREMAIEYLNRYQVVPVRNGRNMFNAIVRILEETGTEERKTESRNQISRSVQEMSEDVSKAMIDSMAVRVKDYLNLNGKREYPVTGGQKQEKRSISPEEREARGIMRQVDDVIQKKIGLAKDILENSIHVKKVSEEGYRHFIGYLNDIGRDAERFFGERDIKGLQSMLEKANQAAFTLEESEGEKNTTPAVSAQSEQEKSGERTYEELEKTLTKIKRKSCAGIVSEGITPYENERISSQAEYPDLTLKDVIDHYGVDAVAKSFALAVAKLLPDEWSEAEQNLFALEFTKKEIIGCFE